MSLSAEAQKVVKLWDNATAPHSSNLTGPEKDEGEVRYSNTTEAVLYIFEAKKKVATGQAVVICPGGGYALVAMGHEGLEYGKWLAEQGITAAVLKYRMPNNVPQVPMEDAAEALRYMKEDYKSKTPITQLGIMGFSAGGHLAASTAVGVLKANGDESPRAAIRPDFAVLFYPVITSDELFTHKGTYNNLLGSDRTEELSRAWCPLYVAGEDAPPALMILSDDDKTVPSQNSTLFYNKLKELGKAASIAIYPTGGHGWGFRDSLPYKSQWQQTLLQWLQSVKK
ncbi:MAG: alpha/beta hydrolase [Alistipes sp.]|nr:alpha/beta hydrolase [Alistipes sp.]